MGWFWSSPSSSAVSSGVKPTETPPLPTTTTTQPVAAPSAQQTPPTPSQSSAVSSSGDAEIQKFLELLQGDDATKKSSQSSQQQQQQQTPSPTTSSEPAGTASASVLAKYKAYIPFSSLLIKDDPTATEPEAAAAPKKTRSPTSLAMSEHCLPTTMSCRDAFDYAWHCQTPGAQFNAVYRYGTMKNCSELWDDFWFCMRTKSFGPEMKAEAVKEYYRSKEEAKYGGGQPSSEDVWESRETRVEWDSEFRQSWEGPEKVSDEEFKRMEVERRRLIREQLGLDEK
ncbi:hypothetical protein QR685DRAFT_522726 [Neurospora intermedia]|uniref:Early meiotic induction protein 1 n=1 Tax=Neurospora intermedia TaxID=5142 RepID=A0ABR3DE86_NEUIN